MNIPVIAFSKIKHHLNVDPLWGECLAGSRFFEACRRADSGITDPKKLSSLAKKQPARILAEATAESLSMSFQELKPMIKLTFAVDTLRHNCGDEVLRVIFDPANPQARKSIEQLSRTSDTRQRYRIDKVLSGKSKTIRPQRFDPVFDTVEFKEVPSRLARGRGALVKLAKRAHRIKNREVKTELHRLLKLTQDAAIQLNKLVLNKPATASSLIRLDKERVFAIVRSRVVTGYDVGDARKALRLTVKNVWDYPEMCRRKLFPSSDEKSKSCEELLIIKREIKTILEY